MPSSVKAVVQQYERLSNPPDVEATSPSNSPVNARHIHPLLRTHALPTRIHTAGEDDRPSRLSRLYEHVSAPRDVSGSRRYSLPSVMSPPTPAPSRHLMNISLSNLSSSAIVSSQSSVSAISYVNSSDVTLSSDLFVSKPSITPPPHPESSILPPQADHKEDGSSDKMFTHHVIDIFPAPSSQLSSALPESHSLHAPIPSSEVFSRKAIPLSLPLLDRYLSEIPAPNFTPLPNSHEDKPMHMHSKQMNEGNAEAPRMFPPLEKLGKGKSLADLSYNHTITAPWKNRSTIFSFVSYSQSVQ